MAKCSGRVQFQSGLDVDISKAKRTEEEYTGCVSMQVKGQKGFRGGER